MDRQILDALERATSKARALILDEEIERHAYAFPVGFMLGVMCAAYGAERVRGWCLTIVRAIEEQQKEPAA
jgi:hypothetical protein